MLTRGLVVSIDKDDNALLKKKRKQSVLPVALEGMYLMVIDECNLRCRYCFINNNIPVGYKRSVMNWDVAKRAIDIFFLNLSRNPVASENRLKTISLYGGEPILNFPLIRKFLNYVHQVYGTELRRMGKTFQYSLVTNGTCITKDIAEFLSRQENIAIAVSIDGEKYIHDQQRVYPDEKGSFDRAIKGYQLLKEAGCGNLCLSCTVGEHNIDQLESLLRLYDRYGMDSINMNLLLDTETSKVSSDYMRKASVKILKYFEGAREKGIYEERIMRKLKSFVSHKIHAFDCQATGNQIVCSPDGKLGVCHEGIGSKNFFFADVFSRFDFHNNLVIQEWNQRSPLNMPQCFDCPAIGICGGGCAYGAKLRNGSIWSIDDRFCIHSLITLEWLIWDLFRNIC